MKNQSSACLPGSALQASLLPPPFSLVFLVVVEVESFRLQYVNVEFYTPATLYQLIKSA